MALSGASVLQPASAFHFSSAARPDRRLQWDVRRFPRLLRVGTVALVVRVHVVVWTLVSVLLLTAAGVEPPRPRVTPRSVDGRSGPSGLCGASGHARTRYFVVVVLLLLCPVCMKWHLVVLVFISLPTNDAENLFIAYWPFAYLWGNACSSPLCICRLGHLPFCP